MFEKSNANKPKLTEGKIFLQLFELTLPMVWGVFSVFAFSLADTYFVAQLGTNELAAMSFTFPVVAVLASVAMGLGVGTSSVIARVIGEGNRQKVQRLTTDSLLLSLLIVIILAFGGLATINPLFTALGAQQELLPLIGDYMKIWYLGMVFLVVPLVGNSAIRASGNTVVPSLIMTFAAATNTLLDPLLIFGWGLFETCAYQLRRIGHCFHCQFGLQCFGEALAGFRNVRGAFVALIHPSDLSRQPVIWPVWHFWGCLFV